MRTHNIKKEALSEVVKDIQKYSPYPQEVNIVAVTKNFNYSSIMSAQENNIPCIGENKVQEFLTKKEEMQNKLDVVNSYNNYKTKLNINIHNTKTVVLW